MATMSNSNWWFRNDDASTTLPFDPGDSRAAGRHYTDAAADAISAIDSMSRRIDDLARELDCLGHFDNDDDDQPRAA